MNEKEIFQTLSSITNNPHYVKRYVNFIFSRKQEGATFELHHILPKSLWPDYKDLRMNKWNGIKLTPKEHFIAHHILAKALGNKMWIAFHSMCYRKKPDDIRITASVYDRLRLENLSHSADFARKTYGVDNVFQAEAIKTKIKETMFKKFGVENPSQSEDVKKKKVETTLAKFGVQHHNQLEEHKERISKTTKLTRARETDKVCEYCGTLCKQLNYKKWHGENCKDNPNSKRQLYKCSYCSKEVTKTNLIRWHNDKCKMKPA